MSKLMFIVLVMFQPVPVTTSNVNITLPSGGVRVMLMLGVVTGTSPI